MQMSPDIFTLRQPAHCISTWYKHLNMIIKSHFIKNLCNQLWHVWGTDTQNCILMQGPRMTDLHMCSKVLILPFVGFDLTGESGNSATIAAQRDSCWVTLCTPRTSSVFLGDFSEQWFHKMLWKWTRSFCSGRQWKYHLNVQGVSSSLAVERKRICHFIDKAPGLVCRFYLQLICFLIFTQSSVHCLDSKGFYASQIWRDSKI